MATAVPSGTCGVETPARTASPNSARTSTDARTAPASWATQYGTSHVTGTSRFNANARLTTGLRCAPDTSPIA